jgi:hypothetical protein
MMRSLLIAIAACFAAPTTAAPTAVPMNIVATANATATLSTLVKALVAGGLVDTLSGSDPFTVFAPTDLAFAQLPAGTLERLLDPHNVRQLQAILLYHVAAGNIPSTDFGPRQEVTTANGAQVLIVTNMTAPPPYVSFLPLSFHQLRCPPDQVPRSHILKSFLSTQPGVHQWLHLGRLFSLTLSLIHLWPKTGTVWGRSS